MIPKTFITVILYATAMSVASEQCEDGSLNQHLCQKKCNFSHCSCKMTETTPFSSCSQNCNFLSSCPTMACSGRNVCAQKCFFGMCNMNCASSKLCSQSCVWKAKCRHIKCSASTCNQVCTNCTMECVKGVERCDQMCLGGECRMECFAQHCKRQCVKGKCYYIGQSQSMAPIIYGWIWIFTTGVFMLLLNT
ncbi:uncharacterized protein [Porites lutea]|uniref:uncharacterized protein n=1 Tax=Porites lutea TaxID=51062 RepID=UPI003CC6898D